MQEWTLDDTARVLIAAVYIFHERRAGDIGSSHFTKDDPLAVAIVAASANLRAHAYGIPRQTQFAAMGMAGNIIHAIATTNAVVAGMVTLEAVKLLCGCEGACRTTFLSGVRYIRVHVQLAVTDTARTRHSCRAQNVGPDSWMCLARR